MAVQLTEEEQKEVCRLYSDEGWTTTQLAEKFGYRSSQSISNLLEKRNVPRRKGGNRRKGNITSYGRECSICGSFKIWDDYTSGIGPNGKSSTCKECERMRGRSKVKPLKIETFARYGGTCCCLCGESDLDMLELDHVNDNGADERRLLCGAGTNFYAYLKSKNYPPGYQVLCASHNRKKELMRRRGDSWEDYVNEYQSHILAA